MNADVCIKKNQRSTRAQIQIMTYTDCQGHDQQQ